MIVFSQNHTDNAKIWNQFQDHEAKDKEVFDPFKDLNREWLSQPGFFTHELFIMWRFKILHSNKKSGFFQHLNNRSF